MCRSFDDLLGGIFVGAAVDGDLLKAFVDIRIELVFGLADVGHIVGNAPTSDVVILKFFT